MTDMTVAEVLRVVRDADGESVPERLPHLSAKAVVDKLLLLARHDLIEFELAITRPRLTAKGEAVLRALTAAEGHER